MSSDVRRRKDSPNAKQQQHPRETDPLIADPNGAQQAAQTIEAFKEALRQQAVCPLHFHSVLFIIRTPNLKP
jgi:hypothetical protein